MDTLYFNLITKSNLCIGGTPASFEIGGVDLCMVTDTDGNPYIPASTFKGALRNIVRERAGDSSKAQKIGEAYRYYLEKLQKKATEERVKEIFPNLEQERMAQMKNRFEKEMKKASAECLFGIQGFNTIPRLMFHDLILEDVSKNPQNQQPFSLDYKNTIFTTKEDVAANPRSYQTVRPGITFCGKIRMCNIESLAPGEEKAQFAELVREFILESILVFNDGIHRLGNSKSRGYGKVEIQITGECN